VAQHDARPVLRPQSLVCFLYLLFRLKPKNKLRKQL
jgi:hypothetical protein